MLAGRARAIARAGRPSDGSDPAKQLAVFHRAATTLTRVGKLARIAAAAHRARGETDAGRREMARRALCLLLADARGIPMKVGQLLATGEEGDAFAPLVTGIEQVPLEQMEPEIERALGRRLGAVFASIEPEARAASLGQVHRARLLDGADVAVKVQYPGIAGSIDAELRLAGLLPGLGPVRRWSFDLDGYRGALRANMDRELDYRNEAARQARFAREVVVPGLVVPVVYTELCASTLLVQSWERGVALEAVSSWPVPARLRVGQILLEALFKSLFSTGLVHGDPHPGNYLFRTAESGRPEVVLLDYGCTIDVSEPARLALLKLLLALREGRSPEALSCFVALGFSASKLLPIAEVLDGLSQALFEPFLTDAAFDMKSWRLGERFEALLGELKWWFRSAGPPELFLLLRAFQGAMQQLSTLGVALPWWPILVRAVGPDLLEQARGLEVPRVPNAPPSKVGAKLLKVQVERGGERVVSLAFPARSALCLEEIVPPDVAARLSANGVDLQALQARLERQGLVPQSVFEDRTGEQHTRVWLE